VVIVAGVPQLGNVIFAIEAKRRPERVHHVYFITRKPHSDYHWRPRKSTTYIKYENPGGVCLMRRSPVSRLEASSVGVDWALSCGSWGLAKGGVPLAAGRLCTCSDGRLPVVDAED